MSSIQDAADGVRTDLARAWLKLAVVIACLTCVAALLYSIPALHVIFSEKSPTSALLAVASMALGSLTTTMAWLHQHYILYGVLVTTIVLAKFYAAMAVAQFLPCYVAPGDQDFTTQLAAGRAHAYRARRAHRCTVAILFILVGVSLDYLAAHGYAYILCDFLVIVTGLTATLVPSRLVQPKLLTADIPANNRFWDNMENMAKNRYGSKPDWLDDIDFALALDRHFEIAANTRAD